MPAELLDGDDVLSAEASDDDPAGLVNDCLVAIEDGIRPPFSMAKSSASMSSMSGHRGHGPTRLVIRHV